MLEQAKWGWVSFRVAREPAGMAFEIAPAPGLLRPQEDASGMSQYRVARTLPYAAGQLFDLAADVEQYPSFLPFWAAARVTRRAPGVYWTDQVLRLGMVRQRFETRTLLKRPRLIEVISEDRRFRLFRLSWKFESAGPAASHVELETEVEFKSRLTQRVFDLALAGSLTPVINAFEKRARAQFGDISEDRARLAGTTIDSDHEP